MWNGPVSDICCPICQNTNTYPYGAAYVVTAIDDANGCRGLASVYITVNPFPYVPIEGPLSPVTIYNNDTLIALFAGASSMVREESKEITVYPNPNNVTFNLLLLNVAAICKVEIYNVLGVKVCSEALAQSQGNGAVNLTGQPNGVYLYRVITENA